LSVMSRQYYLFHPLRVEHRHLHSFPTRRSSDLVAVNEQDQVGVLLDGSGFAQVRQQRALVAALLESAVELGQSDHRAVELLGQRSEEHTSELQSRENLVCRLLLEKKKETSQRTY